MSYNQLGSACRAVVLAGLVVAAACASAAPPPPATTPEPPTTTAPPPSTSSPTSTSTAPPTTGRQVTMPRLVGMTLTAARRALSGRGLRSTVRYAATGRAAAGTVISQTHRAGIGVRPGTAVGLVIAKAPPPTSPPAPEPAPSDCDPSYPGVCLHTGIGDYDCAGGSGNGPNYVDGPIRVRPPDPFGLDRDGNGWGCES
jgi:PASTA domain